MAAHDNMCELSRRQTWPVYALAYTNTDTCGKCSTSSHINNMEVVIRVYAFARGFTLGRA